MKLTKEQIIYYITNITNPMIRVDLIRSYCIEKGKEQFETELFLQYCRDINEKCKLLHTLGKLNYEPEDLFLRISNFIIMEKSIEFSIIYLFDCNNNLILIY